MSFIQLGRRFVLWTKDFSEGDDWLAYYRSARDELSWGDLLEKRRVVILAEAGSGKSIKLKQQADASRAKGRFYGRSPRSCSPPGETSQRKRVSSSAA